MRGFTKSLGKAFIISGLLPSLIFVILNVFFFIEDNSNLQETKNILKGGVLEILFIGVISLAAILLTLNTSIIKFYEGFYKFPKFFLKIFLKKNLARHENVYKNLEVYKEEYNNTDNDIKRNNLAHAIEKEWKRILLERDRFHIPMDRRRILPTRLGNIFATIEEYPNIRYGMDGMVYWPRLIPVIPKEYSDIIADEKINIDFLINLSLLSGIFAMEMLIKFVYNYEELMFLLLTILSFTLFYIFYRVSTMNVVAMGELIKSCFDLFRYDILNKMNIDIPDKIEEERFLWYRLSNYITSGESFYYPDKE